MRNISISTCFAAFAMTVAATSSAADAPAAAPAAPGEAPPAAADAQKTADAALEKATSLEARLDDLKSGKFIQYGITAGAALVAVSPSIGGDSSGIHQTGFGWTLMPYVMVVPGYWFVGGDITASYCASAYGNDVATAQQKANAYSRRKAVADLVGQDLNTYNAGNTEQKELFIAPRAFSVARIVPKSVKGSTSPATQKEIDDAIIANKSYHGDWNPNLSGKCGLTRFGFVLGKPASYNATVVSASKAPETKAQVDSDFAIGVAYAPNAYVTVMLVVAPSSITIPGSPKTDTAPAGADKIGKFSTLMLGVGGNIDAIGKLFQTLAN